MTDYCYDKGRVVRDPDDEDLGEPGCDGDCGRCPE